MEQTGAGLTWRPRTAAVLARAVPALLVLTLICAFAYDMDRWPTGLLAAFVLGGVPLAIVAGLDLVVSRRLSPGSGAPEGLMSRVVVGIPFLLFGTLITAIEVGVGGQKHDDFQVWSSTAVGDLLIAALVGQVLLCLLMLLVRGTRP